MNRCLYLTKEHTLYIKEEEIPKLVNNQVIVQIKANGICGSDIHFYKQGVIGKVIEPYIPGHECSGIVTDIGKDVKGLSLGQKVVIEPSIPCGKCYYCRIGRYNQCDNLFILSAPGNNGTFCDYVAIRSDMVHPIPESMSFELGAMVEPASVGAHAINRAGDVKGKSLVILGAGPIGIFVMQAFKASGGGEVTIFDIVQSRLDFAKKMGADNTFNSMLQGEVPDSIADVVIETAGSSVTTGQLIKIAKKCANVVQVGWVRGEKVPMDIEALTKKELSYHGARITAGVFPTVIKWIANGRIDGKALISHRFTFDKAAEAFEFSATHKDEVIKTVVFNLRVESSMLTIN
jgi:L-iditol 2-dehydrogenase